MITLNHPLLILLLPLPYFIRLFLTSSQKTEAALPVPFLDRYLPHESSLSQQHRKNHHWSQWLYVTIWCLIVIALARPIYLGPPISHAQSGRNVMLAVDISDSMQRPDMLDQHHQIRRIDLVKRIGTDFIKARQGDRLGLILFGSRAFLQSPLSFDLNTVSELLDDASVGIAGSYTAIGDAIGLAIKHLQAIPEKQRVLILLTDGASNTGTLLPLQAARLAKDYQVKIHCIGLGSAQVAFTDLSGNTYFAPSNDLDEATLKKIAALTGGQFFRAQNSADLKKIYSQINQLEPIPQTTESFRLKQDYYYIPLVIAFLLSTILVGSHIRFKLI